MSKRFIDTGIFDDDWFMDLSKDAKILWFYFITKCDHAGILHLNPKLCQLQTGIKNIETVMRQLGNRIVTVKGQLFFIPKYVEYQYPGFPDCKFQMAKSAIAILEKYDLIKDSQLTVREELTNSYGIGNGNGIGNGIGKREEKKSKKCFIIPLLSEVESYFAENGYKNEIAIKAFNYYSTANWVDSKGNSVKNWKQKMIAVWFKDENKIAVDNDDLEYKKLKEKLYGKQPV
jgi:hypothetical protein